MPQFYTVRLSLQQTTLFATATRKLIEISKRNTSVETRTGATKSYALVALAAAAAATYVCETASSAPKKQLSTIATRL